MRKTNHQGRLTMLLYSSPSSYYSMIARLALLECGATFTIRPMDIHIAKDQLSSWYLALNPAMTVPTLTDENQSWTDSRTILEKAALIAGNQWGDADLALAKKIHEIVEAHYTISIERLTFGKAMTKIKPLHTFFPHLLKRTIKNLESSLPNSENPEATQRKIDLNQERINYFTKGNLHQKLESERDSVRHYLSLLPVSSNEFLFGSKFSSADVVTTILCARLQMIGEYDLAKTYPSLVDWFERMKTSPAFQKADIWTHFKPWRIILRY